MKQSVFLRAAAPAVLALSLVLSCAQSPEAAGNAVPAASAVTGDPSGGPAPVPAAAPPVEDRLPDPAFKNIPAGARDYLERLSRAFSAHDEAFLLAQGEPHFENEVRPRHDAESYLALLYRIGVYAGDSPRLSGPLPRLVPALISHIQYLSWEETGPLLEIKARLIGKDGKITPCLIMLVWRLREPKIEGYFP